MELPDFSLPGSDPTQPNSFVQTPQQLTYQQQLARELILQGTSSAPIQSPWQGAAQLGKAILGGMEMRGATQAQKAAFGGAVSDYTQGAGIGPRSAALAAAIDPTSVAAGAPLQLPGAAPPQGNAYLAAALGAPAAAPTSASPSGSFQPPRVAPTQGATIDPGSYPNTPAGHAAYIAARAASLGVDPQFATSVAGAEGLNAWSPSNPNAASLVDRNPDGTPFSFGDFQLNVRNGLGNAARAAGIDPADPAQWQKADDFALNYMATRGLQPWQGDKAVEAYRAGRAPGAVASIPPSPAMGAGTPAPSQAAIAQLSSAMQPAAPPSTGFGLIGPAEAAPAAPQMDPRLAGAASLSAPLPAGVGAGAAPVNPYVDHLSPAAAASPLAQGGNISSPALPAVGAPAVAPAAPAPPMRAPGVASSLDTATAPGTAPAIGAGAPPQSATPAPPQGAPGSLSAFHPDPAALMRVLANPWATPQMQAVALELLKTQLPTVPSIVEGPVDPQTGYPSRLLFSTTRGIMGRLNADGSVTPVGAGAVTSGAPASPNGGAPIPPPPPGVDPKKWREEMATRSAQDASPTATNELEFAQKLTDRQSYKEFTQALPTWNAFTQHVQDNTPAADKAIIDDFAKILNPGRAVTTGAFILNLDAQSIPAELKATIAKWSAGEGELGPDARAQMARVAQEKMTQYKSAWDTDATQATKVAQAHGLAVDRVIPQTPDVAPLDLGKVNSTKTMAGAPKPASAASAPSPAVIGAMRADPQGTLAQARTAIAARPDLRGAVIQRLQAAGIDPAGL